MSYQYVGVGGDSGIVAALAVGDAIAHKHRNAVELNAIYFDTGVAEIMHIVVKAVDVSSIEAVIMIAADENLVFVWQVAKPVEEIDGFLLGTNHAEVTGMHHHIGFGQIPKSAVAAVRIREVEYFHKL